MTRTHALRQLLALGPLTRRQIVEIMGGNQTATETGLRSLRQRRLVIVHSGVRSPGACGKVKLYALAGGPK